MKSIMWKVMKQYVSEILIPAIPIKNFQAFWKNRKEPW